MTIRAEHELHRRRFSRNLGVGLSLAAFVVLVFLLTMVKVTQGDQMQGYDHTPDSVPVKTLNGADAPANGQPANGQTGTAP